MKHNHPSKEECNHEKLTYCKECDVVECECGREWKTVGSWTTGTVNGTYTTPPNFTGETVNDSRCIICGEQYKSWIGHNVCKK